MIYGLSIDIVAQTLIRRLHPGRKKKIKESLRAIAADPTLGKPLQDKLLGLHSYRVGAWRIIYFIDRPSRMVHVVAIGPRSSIYKDLESSC